MKLTFEFLGSHELIDLPLPQFLIGLITGKFQKEKQIVNIKATPIDINNAFALANLILNDTNKIPPKISSSFNV